MSYEKLLREWHESVRQGQKAHYQTAAMLARYHLSLGLVTVILSTVVGSSLFATLQDGGSVEGKLAIGIASVVAAIFAAAQGFLRYSERADVHRRIAATLSALKRELEVQQAFPAEDAVARKTYADEFLAKWRTLLEDAPTPDERTFRRVRAEIDKEARNARVDGRLVEA